MLYDYKTEELVQDIILEDIELLINDITEEFYTLRRYNELDIYAPSHVTREIVTRLLEEVDELWVPVDSHNELLYRDNIEILITISNDGMIFVEEARIKGVLKSCEDSSLVYVYDGFSKKDIDVLSESAESILVFGFEDDYMNDECTCNEFVKCSNCACKDTEKKSVADNSSSKENFFVNGRPVTKEEFDKKYTEFEDKYMDNIRDMLLRYCDLMDAFNDYQKLFRW